MRRRLLVGATAMALGLGAPVTAQNGVIFIGHEKVAVGGTIVTTPSVIVQLNRRTETGMSEVHDKETDTFHVLSGSATFVTGGEMLESKPTAPGQYRGSGLRGGTSTTSPRVM